MCSNCPCRRQALRQPSGDLGARFPQRIATETDALIGTPEEIIRRLQRLRAAGVEYVLVIDVRGSLSALRTFEREVMPEFAE
jgi:alkanesulfonate monooxygenase SsuD/methylene tetrahydromethanopterin reductase-like flavin-dependent oxidoreductase (luciferase family)